MSITANRVGVGASGEKTFSVDPAMELRGMAV